MRRHVARQLVLSLGMVLSLTAGTDASTPGGTFTDEDGNDHEGVIEAIAAAGITNGLGDT